MIRLIIKIENCGAAINLGEDVERSFKTFDCNLPKVEEFLSYSKDKKYETRRIIGAEIIKETT